MGLLLHLLLQLQQLLLLTLPSLPPRLPLWRLPLLLPRRLLLLLLRRRRRPLLLGCSRLCCHGSGYAD
jgi:hypothetical protein